MFNMKFDIITGSDKPIAIEDPSITFWNTYGERIGYLILGIIIGIMISFFTTLIIKKHKKATKEEDKEE